MFKKSKGWRWLISICIAAGLLVSTTGCAKLQEALEQAIQQYEESQGTAIVETTVDVEISGKVQYYSTEEGTNLPLDNATVVVSYGDGDYERKGYTDSRGKFSVYGKSLRNVDRITISASLSGYIAGESTVLEIDEDFDESDTRIRVGTLSLNENSEESTGGILKGTVSFLFSGVPEATVTITDKESGEVVTTVETNAEGSYTVSGLTLGTSSSPKVYIVSAIKEGENGEELFLNNSYEVSLYPPSNVKVSQDISLEATSDFAAEFENQEIIHAMLKPTDDEHDDGHEAEFSLPDFVIVAKATLVEFKGTQSDDFVSIDEDSQPEVLIDRSTGRIIFPNVQAGEYIMRVEIGVEGSLIGSTGVVVDSHEYLVETTRVSDFSTLPQAQSVGIQKSHFSDIAGAFDKIQNIWIENEVRINSGGWDEAARQARIEFERNGNQYVTETNQDGWFGMDLPESGMYSFKVYLRDDSGSLSSQPEIQEMVEINGPDDSHDYYDSWAWWRDAGHDYVVMINREFDADKLQEINKGVIRGYVRLNGDHSTTLTESVDLEVYYARDDSISFPVTVSGGQFEVEVPFLNDGYQIRVVGSDTYSVSDPGMYYWPSDQYSHGYNNTFDVWLREKGFRFESRVYAKSGDMEVGVPDATLKLYTVNGSDKTLIAEATTYSGAKSEKHGEFSLQFNEPTAELQDYELVIESEQTKTRTLSIWMEFDPNVYDDVFQNYDTNLSGYRWNGFEVKATTFIGQMFPVVMGRLDADGSNSEKVRNAEVTLRFVGTDFSVTGTSDDNGEFEIENVPAMNSPIEVTVAKGADVGKVNWEVWFDWNDVDQITRDPGNFISDVELNNGHSMWVEFNGFELEGLNVDMKFNQGTYGVEGALITLTNVNDSNAVVTRSSVEGGSLNGVYIPADGTYDVTVSKEGFNTIYFQNLTMSKNENWNNYGLGYNLTLVPSTLSGDDMASILPSVKVTGVVQYDGLNLPNMDIMFKPMYEDTTFVATTDDSGEYEIYVPMVGEFEVSIEAEGFIEENRTEWFYEHDGTVREMDFELKVPGDSGGLWVNEYKFEFLGVAEAGQSPSAEGYAVLAKIQMWENDQNINFEGGDDYSVKLVDAENDSSVLATLMHAGFGVWKYDGNTMVGDQAVIDASVFDGVKKVKLVVESIRETSAGTFTSTVYPSQHDEYQQSQSEKKLPSPDDVFTYMDDLEASIVQHSEGQARLQVEYSDFWSEVGVGGQYVLSFTNTSTNTSSNPDFTVYQWSDGSRSSDTFKVVLDRYLWLEDQSLDQLYPNGLPAGEWTVALMMEDGSGAKLMTTTVVTVDADIPWEEAFEGTADELFSDDSGDNSDDHPDDSNHDDVTP